MDWRPHFTVTGHSGQTLEPSRFFFVNPPAEIGTILSAETTVRSGRFNFGGWLIASLLGFLIGVLVFLGCIALGEQTLGTAGVLIVGGVLSLGAMVGTTLLARPADYCTFVGEKGVFRARRKGSKLTEELLTFSSQLSVKVGQTRHYYNGIYNGTHYDFRFDNAEGKRVFGVNGSYYEWRGKVPLSSSANFGRAAEYALANYQLNHVLSRLSSGESLSFTLIGDMTLELFRNRLVIYQAKKFEEIPLSELEAVHINQGEVTLRRTGGKSGFLGIGRQGVYSFPYSALPNAQLFFHALQHCLHNAQKAQNS